MTTTLMIARHGNTFGPGDIVKRVGITDLPLVESGLQQAHKLGLYLKKNNLIPDAIFSSELTRAKQTAAEAQKSMNIHLPLETLSILNEIDYGPDENQAEAQVIARVGEEALKAWENSAKVPNGWKVDPEKIINDWKNFAEYLIKEFSGQRILVLTSNGIARFSPYLTGNYKAFCEKHPIKISTGALCIFENSPPAKTWQCVNWNLKPT